MHSQAYKRYVTGLLLCIYIFNQADRQIFGFLMEPIKHELMLTDTQLGFLAGPALVLFYATLGIPVARLADRYNRVNIMAIAITIWSIVAMLSSTVGKFWHLALARVGVGVGEAGFSAVGQSVIGDYHTPAERTRALSIFMLAIPLGSLLSNVGGGLANQEFGWRAAFVIIGFPGLILAILLKLTVKEPPRGATTAAASASADAHVPLRHVVETLWHCRSLRHLAIAQGLSCLVLSSLQSWVAPFFIRLHGLQTAELGVWLAVIATGGGSLGMWLGGYLTTRYGSQDEAIQGRILAASAALAVPIAIIALLLPAKLPALLLFIPAVTLMHVYFAPAFSLAQSLTPVNMRTTMLAIFILLQTLLGGIVGVQAVGLLSDAFAPALATDSLRWALVLIMPCCLWAAVHYWLASRHLRDDMANASAGVFRPMSAGAMGS